MTSTQASHQQRGNTTPNEELVARLPVQLLNVNTARILSPALGNVLSLGGEALDREPVLLAPPVMKEIIERTLKTLEALPHPYHNRHMIQGLHPHTAAVKAAFLRVTEAIKK